MGLEPRTSVVSCRKDCVSRLLVREVPLHHFYLLQRLSYLVTNPCTEFSSHIEAPVNGYAFGKGVYLADLSSKSANYCVSSLSGGVGLLMLVEAELSNPMYEITSGDSSAAEKARKHNCIATKGVGRTGPASWKDASCVNEQLKGVMMVG